MIETIVALVVGFAGGLVFHDKAVAVYEWIRSKLHTDTVDVADPTTTAEVEAKVAQETVAAEAPAEGTAKDAQ